MKMKTKRLLLMLIGVVALFSGNAFARNFHSFKMKDIDGNVVSLKIYKGKKVLVVNVASLCVLTPEYRRLQELYNDYEEMGLVVLGFPANNFNRQEPGSNAAIRSFCSREYQVTFPMMSKISVKGPDIHPLYKWLTQKELNGVFDAPVKWNFQKFFIDERGNLVGFMEPDKNSDFERIRLWIETGIF
jgi:glutathione peroxidase